MSKIVEVKFNAIVEDDFVEEFEKIVDHKIDRFLNLSEFPKIGSVYYARTKILGNNTVGEVLDSCNKSEEDNTSSENKEKENENNDFGDKVWSDIYNLFGGVKTGSGKSNLKPVGNMKYIINFNNGEAIGFDAFDNICSKLNKAIKEDKALPTVTCFGADSTNYSITIYEYNKSILIETALPIGISEDIGRVLNNIIEGENLKDIEYFIESYNIYTYKNK